MSAPASKAALPPLAGLCSHAEGARSGLGVDATVGRLRRYAYVKQQLVFILAERFNGEVGLGVAPAAEAIAVVHANSAARTVRMKVRFPSDRTGVCEPLLTTGHTGAADNVYVRYGEAGQMSVGFDHWGAGGPESAPVAIDFSKSHVLELMLGDGPWERSGAGRLQVRLDGRVVIDESVKFHPARVGEIVFGENPVGLSTSVPEFSGVLISLESR